MEKGVEAGKVFRGGWVEALDQGGDVLGTRAVKVEQECGVRARPREGGERDAFGGPALWVLVRSVRGRQKLGEEWVDRPRRF